MTSRHSVTSQFPLPEDLADNASQPLRVKDPSRRANRVNHP